MTLTNLCGSVAICWRGENLLVKPFNSLSDQMSGQGIGYSVKAIDGSHYFTGFVCETCKNSKGQCDLDCYIEFNSSSLEEDKNLDKHWTSFCVYRLFFLNYKTRRKNCN